MSFADRFQWFIRDCLLVGLAFAMLGSPVWAQGGPVAEAGGPYVVSAGGSVVLDANGTHGTQDLREILLALANYHSAYHNFPPAYVADGGGTPLLSWRVLLLSLTDPALFAQFDTTKAWDDPANLPFLGQMPEMYRGTFDPPGSTATRYAAVFGSGTAFIGQQDSTIFDGPIRYASMIDGSSNTAMIGEVAGLSIPWTKPEDVNVAAHPSAGDPDGFSSSVAGFAALGFADGAVYHVPVSTPPATMTLLYQIADGQVIAPFPGQSLAFDFAWDLDGDGTFETPGSNPVFDAPSEPATSTVTVTLRATNDLGEEATDDAIVQIVAAVPAAGKVVLVVLGLVILLLVSRSILRPGDRV